MSAIKEKLMRALNTAVSSFNSGLDENASVVKTAQDMNLNRDETQRLIEMFNTGKALHHYKQAGEDRTGLFTLAEPDVIFSRLLTPKKAAAPIDYSFYEQPVEKAACADDSIMWDGIQKQGSMYSLNDILHSIFGRLDTLQALEKKAASAKTACELSYNYSLTSLQDSLYAKQNQLPLFNDAVISLHGAAGEKIAADLAYRLGVEQKRAAVRGLNTFLVENADIAALVDTAATAYHGFTEMDAVREKAAGDLQSYNTQLKEAMSYSFRQDNGGAENFTDLDSMLTIKAAAPKGKSKSSDKSSDDMPDALTSPVSTMRHFLFDPQKDSIADKITGKAVDTSIGSISDPLTTTMKKIMGPDTSTDDKLFEKVRNMQRQTLMEEMLVRDPILRTADPTTVAQAYAALIRTAPEVSLNKEVVRSILRQAVQASGISPYDMKNVADLENTMRKNLYMTAGPQK